MQLINVRQKRALVATTVLGTAAAALAMGAGSASAAVNIGGWGTIGADWQGSTLVWADAQPALDATRIREDVGWTPRIPLDQTLSDILAATPLP